MDFFPRASKKGGAWMTSYQKQKTVEGKRLAPVISIVCNFSKPTAGNPSLLTFDETTTSHGLQAVLVVRGSNPEYSRALLSKMGLPFEKGNN